jgi:hypothetical protein
VHRDLRWSLASGEPFIDDFGVYGHTGTAERVHWTGGVTMNDTGDPVRTTASSGAYRRSRSSTPPKYASE